MNEITIREATFADAPTLLHVLQSAFEEYRGRLDPPSGAHTDTVERIRQKMRAARAVLAYLDDAAVGCVFYEDEADVVYFSRLGVLPAYRRQGIARTLIEYVETRTRAAGLTRVRLGVRIGLLHLRAYYERMGYRFLQDRYHDGYLQPTYTILEKELV